MDPDNAAYQQAEHTIRFQAQLLNAVDQAVIATDRDGRIIYWNRAAESLYGWEAPEVMGKDIVNVTPSPISKQEAAEIMARLRAGERWSGEFMVQRRDGTTFPAIVTDAPIYDEDGALIGIIGISTDITEQKQNEAKLHTRLQKLVDERTAALQAEIDKSQKVEKALRESEKRYRSLFQNSAIGIFQSTPEGKFLNVNPALAHMLGYDTPQEVLHAVANIAAQIYVHPEQRDKIVRFVQSTEAAAHFQNEYRRKNGENWFGNLYLRAVRDDEGNPIYLEGFVEDITARKRAEAALDEQEMLFRHTFETILDSALLWRRREDGRIVLDMANSAAMALSEGKMAEYLGGSLDAFFAHSPETAARIRHTFETGKAQRVELFYRLRTTGEKKWIIADYARVSDNYVLNIVRDITERKQMEEALRASEREKALILGSISEMIAYYEGPDLEIVWANRASEESVGEAPGGLSGLHCYEIWHGRAEACTECLVRRVFETGESQSQQIATPDGRIWQVNAYPVPNGDTIAGVVEVGRNVTQQVKAERARRESEMLLRALVENTEDLITLNDLENRILYYNGPSVYGMEPDEVIGKSVQDFFDEKTAARIMKHIEHVLATGQASTQESRVIWQDQTLWFSDHRYPIHDEAGEIVGVGTVSRNITQLKKTEALLAQRNHVLRVLYDTELELGADLDVRNLLERTAERVSALLGIDRGAVVLLYRPDENVLELVTGVEAGRQYTGTKLAPGEGLAWRVFQSREPLVVEAYHQWEHRLHAWDDTVTIQTLMGVPLVLKEETLGVLVFHSQKHSFTDEDMWLAEMFATKAAAAIERARLYQELETYNQTLAQKIQERTEEVRQVQRRTEAILNNSPDAILFLRPEGTISMVNWAFCEKFGYTHTDETFGQSPTLMCEPKFAGRCESILQTVIAERQPQRFTFLARTKTGDTFDAEAALAPVQDGDQITGMVCSVRDISAFKALDRMKDAFITNVSHQFRTPVTSMKLYTQMLRRKQRPEKADQYLEVLEKQADRMAALVEDILEITKLMSGPPEAQHFLALPSIANDVLTHYQSQAEAGGITLTAQPFPANLPPMKGSREQIARAIQEIIENAIIFTPKGGKVTVALEACEDGGAITVKDTGPGIPPEEQDRIFERFYRGGQAESGHVPGNGLGLAIARAIIDQHKGRIEVDSAPGEGALFRVWLPAAPVPSVK